MEPLVVLLGSSPFRQGGREQSKASCIAPQRAKAERAAAAGTIRVDMQPLRWPRPTGDWQQRRYFSRLVAARGEHIGEVSRR